MVWERDGEWRGGGSGGQTLRMFFKEENDGLNIGSLQMLSRE